MSEYLFQKQWMAINIFLFIFFLVNPLHGDDGTKYTEYIKALENLQNKKFTDILIDELIFYPHLFPDATNLDEMHFKMASIYDEKNEHLRSFIAHLEFIYLYPKSARLTMVKDRVRTLIMKKKTFKALRDKIENIINPSFTESTKEYASYIFLKDLYNYHFEPVTKLLIWHFEQFIKNYPESSKLDEVLFWKAELLTQDKQYQRALTEYLKLTYLYDKSLYVTASKLKIADLFTEKLKMHQNAILTLEEFLLEYPEDPQAAFAQFHMAQIIEKEKKKYIEAINVYTAVAKNYPASVEAVPALFAAAKLYEEKFKEYDQAIRIYTEVVRDFKDDIKAPYALAEAGRIYENKLKDYFNASNVYFKVYGLYPESNIAAESLYAAAEINEKKLKNFDRAIMYYRLIVDKYPEHKIAKKASARIEKLSKVVNK